MSRQVLPKTAVLMLCVHGMWRLRRHPITLVKLGKIRISVVAKRISPAWRTFVCLNMADCLLLLFLSVKCVPVNFSIAV